MHSAGYKSGILKRLTTVTRHDDQRVDHHAVHPGSSVSSSSWSRSLGTPVAAAAAAAAAAATSTAASAAVLHHTMPWSKGASDRFRPASLAAVTVKLSSRVHP